MKLATRRYSTATARGSFALASLVLMAAAVSPARAAAPVALLGSHLPAQAAYGTIKGQLVWGGAEAPKRAVIAQPGQAAKDPSVCAAKEAIPADDLVVDPKTKGIQFGFAYIAKPKGENKEAFKAIAAKTPKPEVDQLNCRFIPHSLAVTTDQTVVFKSSDPASHNLRYSGFSNGAFNQMMAANSKIEKKFNVERRPIPVGCDIHPWMTGFVMVFDHPFFAVTKEDGSFEITGVPAGTQNLVVWQEKVGYVTPGAARGIAVDVKAGGTTDVGTIKLDPSKVKGLK